MVREISVVCRNGHAYAIAIPETATGPCPHTVAWALNEVERVRATADEIFAAREWLQRQALDPTAPMPSLRKDLVVRVPGQTELVCSCGARLTVVGNNRLACPRCGMPMHCTRCAGTAATPPIDPRCPTCQAMPIRVEGAPRIEISGIVNKVIG